MQFSVSRLLAITLLIALCFAMYRLWAAIDVPVYAFVIPMTFTCVGGLFLGRADANRCRNTRLYWHSPLAPRWL